jgi:hypothetical protein
LFWYLPSFLTHYSIFSFISFIEEKKMLEEEEQVPDRSKISIIKIALWVNASVVLVALLFDVWIIAQSGGGPAIGALIFNLINMGMIVFILLAIWVMKWVHLSVQNPGS